MFVYVNRLKSISGWRYILQNGPALIWLLGAFRVMQMRFTYCCFTSSSLLEELAEDSLELWKVKVCRNFGVLKKKKKKRLGCFAKQLRKIILLQPLLKQSAQHNLTIPFLIFPVEDLFRHLQICSQNEFELMLIFVSYFICIHLHPLNKDIIMHDKITSFV